MSLTEEEIEIGCKQTIIEWSESSKMPPLRFILDRAGKHSPEAQALLEAEQAFELVDRLIRHDWYADGIGWQNGAAQKLTPAMQYAIRQCGGEHKMAYRPEETFQFMRRDFIEAHRRFVIEGGAQVALTAGEARSALNLLRQKAAELPPAQLPDDGDTIG